MNADPLGFLYGVKVDSFLRLGFQSAETHSSFATKTLNVPDFLRRGNSTWKHGWYVS